MEGHPALIEASYNDSRGATAGVQPQHAAGAQPRARRRLRASTLFAHRAFYEPVDPPARDASGRADAEHEVRVPGIGAWNLAVPAGRGRFAPRSAAEHDRRSRRGPVRCRGAPDRDPWRPDHACTLRAGGRRAAA